jgi:hypothetical protein
VGVAGTTEKMWGMMRHTQHFAVAVQAIYLVMANLAKSHKSGDFFGAL